MSLIDIIMMLVTLYFVCGMMLLLVVSFLAGEEARRGGC